MRIFFFFFFLIEVNFLSIQQVMDSLACNEHVILLEHKSGINTRMFNNLILTSSHHLEVLFFLQKYFERRDNEAEFAGMLEEHAISKNSLSVRFANKDDAMKNVIKLIQKKDKQKKEDKFREVERQRKVAARLRGTAECTSPGCYGSCTICSKRAKAKRIRVKVYRTIVMRKQHERLAVAFELRIPLVLACLRDVLYVFVTMHYDKQLGDFTKYLNWIDHPDLAEFATKNSKRVFMCTASKKVTQRSTRGLHPDSPNDDFYDCNIDDYDFLMGGLYKKGKKVSSKMPIETKLQSIKKFATFSVEMTSEYAELQWAVKTTSHTQNSVLAKKSECPPDLSIAEFINFGSLRADGHRLQYLNLYRAISDEGLSFETRSVLALVMQTLWEAGPEPTTENWYRESNYDITNLSFVGEMSTLLEEYIERQQRNWRNPLKLMMATITVCRMFEINSDPVMARRLADVLQKFRSTAITWIGNIKKTISESNANDTNRGYANITDVAICGILTYSANRSHMHFDLIFQNGAEANSAVKAWLVFNDTLNHYNALSKSASQVCVE